jgi:hypothetical protein
MFRTQPRADMMRVERGSGEASTFLAARLVLPTLYPAVLRGAARPRHRENRAAQALMPPLRRMNWSRGSESGLHAAA